MRNSDLIEIKETLARHGVILSTTREDVAEIKKQLIPDGKDRLGTLESDVKSLNRYKNIISGMVALVTSIPIIKGILDIIRTTHG